MAISLLRSWMVYGGKMLSLVIVPSLGLGMDMKAIGSAGKLKNLL
jgi:hypothetical protein